MEYVREKLGKKKKVKLPHTLTAAAVSPSIPHRTAAVQQIRMEDLEPAGAAEMFQEAQEAETGPTDAVSGEPEA